MLKNNLITSSAVNSSAFVLILSIFPHSTPSSYERIPLGLPTPSPLMKAIFSCLMKIFESFLDNHSSTSILGSSISFCVTFGWAYNS
jgi:hypothetical protein